MLRIRPTSAHSKCTTCVKHKAIMRRLASNKEALQFQSRLWGAHMERQFADRKVYWQNRSMSRAGHDINGRPTITIIIDGMDHSKWALPRSACLASKSFGGMVRPHMDCTGIIVHGHLLITAFGHPNVVKGGSWTSDLLTFVFHKLRASGLDLREYEVHIQSDNATKETKNNTICRLLSYYVGRGFLRCARMQFCTSGHSHEDIDQYFSLLGSFLQHQPEIHHPSEFKEALCRYLSNPSVRPSEPLREVVQVDRVRDWKHSSLAKVFGAIQTVCQQSWQQSTLMTNKHVQPRTPFLATHCQGNFIKGMGGPGAPHTFAFDRYADVRSFWEGSGVYGAV